MILSLGYAPIVLVLVCVDCLCILHCSQNTWNCQGVFTQLSAGILKVLEELDCETITMGLEKSPKILHPNVSDFWRFFSLKTIVSFHMNAYRFMTLQLIQHKSASVNCLTGILLVRLLRFADKGKLLPLQRKLYTHYFFRYGHCDRDIV